MTYTALFERGENGTMRGILLETDEETGAKSVVDIIEMNVEGMTAADIAHCFCNYFYYCDWKFTQLQFVNVGRAHTQKGLLTKLLEQLP